MLIVVLFLCFSVVHLCSYLRCSTDDAQLHYFERQLARSRDELRRECISFVRKKARRVPKWAEMRQPLLDVEMRYPAALTPTCTNFVVSLRVACCSRY
jgi:hypothetical protein